MGIVRGLIHHEAHTERGSADPRLLGRRYGVPFREVWAAALRLAGTLRGWRVVEARPARGEIVAVARTPLVGRLHDVTVRVSLDEEGATRVDVRSASRAGLGDLGGNARRIDRFLRRLDRALAAGRG